MLLTSVSHPPIRICRTHHPQFITTAPRQVFVPILSEGAIRNFTSLTDDSPCDNYLLELRLALERAKTGDLKAIMPIFVGDVFAAISTLTIAESAIPSVEKAVQKYLGNAYIEGALS